MTNESKPCGDCDRMGIESSSTRSIINRLAKDIAKLEARVTELENSTRMIGGVLCGGVTEGDIPPINWDKLEELASKLREELNNPAPDADTQADKIGGVIVDDDGRITTTDHNLKEYATPAPDAEWKPEVGEEVFVKGVVAKRNDDDDNDTKWLVKPIRKDDDNRNGLVEYNYWFNSADLRPVRNSGEE